MVCLSTDGPVNFQSCSLSSAFALLVCFKSEEAISRWTGQCRICILQTKIQIVGASAGAISSSADNWGK